MQSSESSKSTSSKAVSVVRKVAVNVSRAVIALTFIFSGFTKAVDPIGTQYKIHDYLQAWGLEAWNADWLTMVASLMLSTAEFFIGHWLFLLLVFGGTIQSYSKFLI